MLRARFLCAVCNREIFPYAASSVATHGEFDVVLQCHGERARMRVRDEDDRVVAVFFDDGPAYPVPVKAETWRDRPALL